MSDDFGSTLGDCDLEVSIESENANQPEVCALLRAGHALMDALIPDRLRKEFSTEALLHRDVHLLVARNEGDAVGCCAIVLKEDYSEIKKMYVVPGARLKGVAKQLLVRSKQVALENGLMVMKLESASVLTTAHNFYARNGYSFRPAFGDHKEDPRSIFMKKHLKLTCAGAQSRRD